MIDPATAPAGYETIEQRQSPLPPLTTTCRVVDRIRHEPIDRDSLQSLASDRSLPIKRWLAAQHPADILRIVLVTVAILAVLLRFVAHL